MSPLRRLRLPARRIGDPENAPATRTRVPGQPAAIADTLRELTDESSDQSALALVIAGEYVIYAISRAVLERPALLARTSPEVRHLLACSSGTRSKRSILQRWQDPLDRTLVEDAEARVYGRI